MSEITIRTATDNFIAADTNRAKTFLGDNRFEVGTLKNAALTTVTFAVGTVLGKVAATGKLVPLASAGTDGSQYPVGILAEEVTLLTTAEASVNICISGDVLSTALIFDGTDVITTVVEDKQIGDRIKSDTLGIKLVAVSDSTFYDN